MHTHTSPRTKSVVDSFVNFLIVGFLSTMRVLLDVHAANNDQHNPVACSIASSREDLHEVTSISSCVDLKSHSAFPSICLAKNDLCLEFLSTTTVYCDPKTFTINVGCWTEKWFHPPILNVERSIRNCRINFGLHHPALHDLFSSR